MDLVVLLCVREALQHEAYQVEQSILLLLRQDGSCGEVGCITLQAEGTRLRRESKHGEVTALFSTSKACCSAAPHDQSFNFQVSAWRGWAISEKLQMNLW